MGLLAVSCGRGGAISAAWLHGKAVPGWCVDVRAALFAAFAGTDQQHSSCHGHHNACGACGCAIVFYMFQCRQMAVQADGAGLQVVGCVAGTLISGKACETSWRCRMQSKHSVHALVLAH